MRLLVHLSDIHFGRVDRLLIEPLQRRINEINPDLVAVSGDLTQRARSYQFRQARMFLDSIPKPQIVVPGNHDVPMHNPFARFLQPLAKYRRFITDELQPSYFDREIAVVGVNSARSLTVKGGRVNERQIEWMREKLCAYDDTVTKVVVTHHPFDLPEGHYAGDLVGRSKLAMTALANCGADVFLSGHLHLSHTLHTAKRYQIKGHSALVVSAGTAASTRGRGEANSFNLIRVDHPKLAVERWEWRLGVHDYVSSATERFRHTSEGWVRE
ncbi:MAG: metallophosphoesterase [Pyrinomonadaceae bacterium]